MPASGNYVLNKGKAAGGAIAKKRFVKLSATPETVVQCTANGEKAYGVSMFTVTTDEIDLGKGVTVQVQGIAIVEASVNINEGEYVATSANGRAKVAATGETILGVCDHAAANAGDECSVVLSIGSGGISAGS